MLFDETVESMEVGGRDIAVVLGGEGERDQLER